MIPSVPVHVSGFSWTAILVALLNVLVGGALVAAIKNWPRLKELTIGQRRDDMALMDGRIASLERQVKEATAKIEEANTVAHTAEMKLVYAVSAVHLLATKIRADNPNDPTLLQAMELLTAATTGTMPDWPGKLGAALGRMKGTGE